MQPLSINIFRLQFDTDEDMQQWKVAFENATAYHLGDDEVREMLCLTRFSGVKSLTYNNCISQFPF